MSIPPPPPLGLVKEVAPTGCIPPPPPLGLVKQTTPTGCIPPPPPLGLEKPAATEIDSNGAAGLPPPPPIPNKSNGIFRDASQIEKKGFSDKIVFERTMKSVTCSEDGTGGVVFITFKHDEFPPVVVKGTSTVVQEIFAFEIALLLGLKPPRYYIVNFCQKEFRQIQYNCRNLVGARIGKIEKELNRPFLIVMEQVPGKDIFRTAVKNGNDKVSETISEYLSNDHVLYEMGRIMILDVLLNNWDRIPLIWNNDGNLENILFSDTPDGPVFAIDQAIYPVTKQLQKNYEKYLAKVTELIEDITSENWSAKDGSPLAKVRDCVKMFTNFDLTHENLLTIRQGLLQTMCDAITTLNNDTLSDMKKKIANIGKIDWQDVFGSGLRAVQLEFMQDIIQIFKQHELQLRANLN